MGAGGTRILIGAALALFAPTGCTVAEPELLSVSVLEATADTAGPYTVDAVIRGDGDGYRLELHSAINRRDPSAFLGEAMPAVDDRDDLYTGAIPGQPAGTDVFYFVVLLDGDGLIVDRDPDPSELSLAYGFQVVADSAQ